MNGVIQRHTQRLTKYIRFPFCTVEQPKWTRFFVQSQPIQVNIERSLKNDASEQLNSYIRNNFKNFSDKQLIMGIMKKDLNYDSHRLMHYELTDRIGQQNKRSLDLETIQYLFSHEIFGYTWTTPIISQYFIIEGANHYDQLTIKQQTQYINFSMRNNYLNETLSLKFLKKLTIDDDYFESFNLQTYKELFKFFDQFKVSVYELGLQEGFLEILFNKYMQFISNYDVNNAGRTDYLNHLIRVFPQYFTQSMRQQIKIVYATIMEKSLNKDYLYILPKQIEVRELSRLLYNLYDISDFPLIKNTLIMILEQYTDIKQDMQYYSLIKKFQYFNPQYFLQVLQSVKSITEYWNSMKNDIYLSYENKLEQVILFKFVEGFKQFKLQDHEIIKMSQSIQQIFSFYFNDLSENALTHGVEELVSNDIDLPPESIYQSSVYQEFAQLYQANQLKIQTEEQKLEQKMDFASQFQLNCKESIERQSEQLNQLGFVYTQIKKNDSKLFPLIKICGFIELLCGALMLEDLKQINFSEIKLFKSTLFLKYFQKLCFVPGLFENVLKIQKLAPELFSEEAIQKIESLKREVDQIYNQATDPQNFIEKIELELEQYDLSKYRADKYIKWSLLRIFSGMNLNSSNNNNQQLKYLKDQGQENNFNETYKISRRNMLFYALNNSIYITKFTPLKQIINQTLKLDTEEWIMNYSDQPFILDFVCKKQKIVIFLDEYPRMIKGVYQIRNIDTTLAEKYYKTLDYQVVYIDYSIYHPNPKELLQILREKLVYRFCTIARNNNPRAILLEMDQSHLGQTFLNALQIGLASGSPVHEISSYINNIRFMLEQEQKDADLYIQNTQQSCQKLLHDFSTNYAYHASQLKAHTKIVEENTNNLQRSLNKIAEVSVEIEDNTKKTNAGQSERDQQYAEFQSKQEDHVEAIAAVDEAYALIEHLSGGSSFIQVKGRFNKVISRMQNQSKGISILFQPILTMMGQMAARADSDTAKKILGLLSNLRVQIVDGKSNDEDIENKSWSNWQKFLGDLTNEKNTLSDQRQNLEQAILNYQSIIEESEGKVEYHSAEFERNKQNVEMQDQWCRSQQDLYQIETQTRVQSLDLIARIIDHIQDKIVTLKEYLRERLKNE